MIYIKPTEVKQYFDEETDLSSYNNAVKAVIEKEDINENERNIILTHQFVTAGNSEPERSDSETKFLGGTENVDVSCYDKFDYVAIGHIHGPQRIGRDMREIKGPIEELLKEENYSKTNREDYIRAIITNEEPIYDAIGQIKKIYPNTLRLDILNSKTENNQNVQLSNIDNIKKKTI